MTWPADSLQAVFHRYEPAIVLQSYSRDHAARLQLLDVDEYRVGTMVCDEVIALCIPTRFQSFSSLSIYSDPGGMPGEFSWLSGLKGFLLIVMEPLCEDEDYEPLLPVIGAQRLAYIICRSAHYESEQNPGR
jgi:hypothetical protein